MTKIFVINCNNDSSNGTGDQDFGCSRNKHEKDAPLDMESKEQCFSIYELLSNEHDLQNLSDIDSFSPSKSNTDDMSNRNYTSERRRSNSVVEYGALTSKKHIDCFKTNLDVADISLHSDQLYQEGILRRRNEIFQSIILNRPIKISLVKGLLCIPLIIIIGLFTTAPLSLIPTHDLIEFPDYWYEHIFHGILSTSLGWLLQCFRASYFLNISKIRGCRNVLFMCLIGDLAMISLIIFSYNVWTRIYGHTYPVPFLGLVATYSFRILYCISQWFSLPKVWRKNAKFRKQMTFFVCYILSTILIDILYNIVVTIVRKTSSQNQPYVSLALPLARELCLWLSTQLVKKCSNGDVGSSKIVLKYIVTTVHTISLCYTVTIVTNTTSWVLMIVDFSINTLICIRIVWLNKQASFNLQSQISLLQDLALYELVEFQAPLTYVIVVVVAYLGPNSKLFGNISNNYWTYKPIENLQETLENMMLLFLIDFSSTILCSIILWCSCKINLWKVFVVIHNEFGKAFCVSLGYIVLVVSQKDFSSTFDIKIRMNLLNDTFLIKLHDFSVFEQKPDILGDRLYRKICLD